MRWSMADEARPKRIASVSIFAKPRAVEAQQAARRCARFLERRGIRVRFDAETARALGRRGDSLKTRGAPTADLCVSVGGDGTLLTAARAHAAQPSPILGVNLGGLGFLTETGPGEMQEVLEEILAGRYALERRIGLDVSVLRAGSTILRQR